MLRKIPDYGMVRMKPIVREYLHVSTLATQNHTVQNSSVKLTGSVSTDLHIPIYNASIGTSSTNWCQVQQST